MSSNGPAPFARDEPGSIGEFVRQQGVELLRRLDALHTSPADAVLPVDECQQQPIDRGVAEALELCLTQLATTRLVGRANEIPSRELWHVAGSRLQLGDLQWHARSKPSGYAGDYRMLEKIIAHAQAAGSLATAFDRFFQSQAAPQAVRNRTLFMGREIVDYARRSKGTGQVVSVGSGPARDIVLAAKQLQFEEIAAPRFTLLDVDPYALEYAEKLLSPWVLPGQLHFQRANLVKLIDSPKYGRLLDDADLIICTGLFDYLSDEQASAMLALFWRQLRPGGMAYVFNFAPENSSRTYMEWIGNWYLEHRNVAQMWKLIEQAKLPADQCLVDAEPLGVNLFVQMVK